MSAPSAGENFFELFGLERDFNLDADDLSRRYRKLQAAAHPDKFAGESEAEKQAALAAASRINEGYRALKDPLSRAAYMLSLAGADAFAESGAQMSPQFLAQQMEWRETLEELQANGGDGEALRAEALQAEQEAMTEAQTLLAAELDDNAKEKLADAVRRWHYIRKLLAEIPAA